MSMSSGKQKNGADACAKKAAFLFVACERNPHPTGRLSIPNVLRVKGYSEDKAVNRMLQMQVRQEVKKLKGNSSVSAAATAMIMLSATTTTITTTTTTCMSLLVSCRFWGLYLFPGLPNATSVQQETDRNYGLFKKVVRRNPAALTTSCYTQKMPIRLSVSTFGLVIYGGVCPQMSVGCEDAIAKAFSVNRNLECWAAVGAVPLRIKCLSNNNVRHNGNNGNDPEYNKCQIIQLKNDYSCAQLSTMVYDANLLKTEFNEDGIRAAAAEEELDLSITVANTHEWQEALAKAATYGKKFYVTGGKHITSDDMFIAAEMGNCKREIAETEKDKKVRVDFHTRRGPTLINLDRLDHKSDSNVVRLVNKEMEVLLRWKGVPLSKMDNMASKRALYQQFVGETREDDLGNPACWTEVDDNHLEALRISPIEMGDPAYERFEAQKKRDVKIAYQKMSVEEKESFKQKMAEIDKTGAGDRQSLPPSPTPV
jgi:hypothetical protein